ncbi:MAG TPA: methyltransferase domain-containing protein [Candidatus Dormibacteraeota bacterium]|nr:methyltransferase domain-containing protein [Candidatus Dormibacteraeota bacterium]
MSDAAAARRWREQLEGWGIPEEIRAQAPEDPWRLPVEPFLAVSEAPLTVSHRRALEALPRHGRVIDVGAGGGAMSRPLALAGAHVVAVDASEEMLEASGGDTLVPGRWPEVAAEAGAADVVVCGHVLYNCGDLAPFVLALDAAAGRRVVVEITESHPRDTPEERALWRHFWDLERPDGPGWEDAVAVLREIGIDPRVERWERPRGFAVRHRDHLVAGFRRRLCLPPERDPELVELLAPWVVHEDGRWLVGGRPRGLVTLWWDSVSQERSLRGV